MLDTGGWTSQPLEGNNMVSGQRCWGQETKTGFGKTNIIQVDRCLAGRIPRAAKTQKRGI